MIDLSEQDEAAKFPKQQKWSLDMWSFGVILLEILLGQPIWINEKINVQTRGQKIDSVQKRGEVVAYSPEITKNNFSRDIGIFGVQEDRLNVTPVISNHVTPKKQKEGINQYSGKKRQNLNMDDLKSKLTLNLLEIKPES